MAKNKSKAPTGRAGAKKKAQKGAANSSPRIFQSARASNFSRQILEDDDEDEYAGTIFRGFAGASQHKPSLRTPTMNLRHQTISFVSAGTNSTPFDIQPRATEDAPLTPGNVSDQIEEDESAGEEFDDSTLQTNIITQTDIDIAEDTERRMNISSVKQTTVSSSQKPIPMDTTTPSAEAEIPDEELFFIDTVGDPSLAVDQKSTGKKPARRDPSPTPSSSEDEVVIFHGRGQPTVVNDPIPATSNALSRPAPHSRQLQMASSSSSRNTSQGPRKTTTAASSSSLPVVSFSKKPKFAYEVDPNGPWIPAPSRPYWKPQREETKDDLADQLKPFFNDTSDEKGQAAAAPNSRERHDGEKTAEETIASLQADWKFVLQAKSKAKKSAQPADEIKIDLKSPKRRGKRGRKLDNRYLRTTVESENDDVSDAAVDDYLANLETQMEGNDSSAEAAQAFTASHFARSAAINGSSINIGGKDIPDDEILKHTAGASEDEDFSNSSAPIGQDQSEISDDDLDLSGLDSSDLEDELEYTEREQWEDEEDLRKRRQEAMTDEQIARIFAKQEELGIHDDELVIDDGDFILSDDIEGVGDVSAARAGLANMKRSAFGASANKHSMRRGRSQRNAFNFPDASALADTVEQYGENGFDIMDFDRPSLRPTKKGRRGKLPPELDALSDEELKQDMRDTWDNDREKKRLKKAERDELRAQGMLGGTGKKGKSDLSQKYETGITMIQVYEELRAFMQNDEQTSRPFPPMHKSDRKALHEIADALGLKSKSIGAGNDRFPVIIKTKRSIYNAQLFNDAVAASTNGLLDRDAKFGSRVKKTPVQKALDRAQRKAAKGGLNNRGAANIRDGEIVGAGAAELGKENFGHKLMEKMGWSKGMALGKEGEGRLVPVEQVVRIGKFGLG